MANTKIYSQGSASTTYCSYKPKAEGQKASARDIDKVVVINGGANVRDKVTGQTPKWAVTEVTKEELEALKTNDVFMRKVERGFISIGKEPADLKKDKSAQKTSKDLKAKVPAAKFSTGETEAE